MIVGKAIYAIVKEFLHWLKNSKQKCLICRRPIKSDGILCKECSDRIEKDNLNWPKTI